MYVPEIPESDSLVKVAADDCVSHSPSSHYVVAAGTGKQSPGTWNGNGKIESSQSNNPSPEYIAQCKN